MKIRPSGSIAAVLLLCCLIHVSCGESSVTDRITVTDINAFISSRDVAKGIVKTYSSIPAVHFSHRRHEADNVACAQCHHKHSNEERIKKCSFCHKGVTGAETVHKNCIGCHKQRKKGPATCDTCHSGGSNLLMNEEMKQQYASSEAYKQNDVHGIHNPRGIVCTVCHHEHGRRDKKDSYEKCSECHTGVSRMRILHAFCKGCHLERNAGPVSCKLCHTSAPEIQVGKIIDLPDTGHRKPSIIFNHLAHVERYNTECFDCHHTHTNQKCTDCHQKKDRGSVINLKSAFHQQCHDCHRKTKGPQACFRCHQTR